MNDLEVEYCQIMSIVKLGICHTICCCRSTPLCLFGGVLPYFEVTGHPVPVSSLEFKYPDCFI